MTSFDDKHGVRPRCGKYAAGNRAVQIPARFYGPGFNPLTGMLSPQAEMAPKTGQVCSVGGAQSVVILEWVDRRSKTADMSLSDPSHFGVLGDIFADHD